MIELTRNISSTSETTPISAGLVQLKHLNGSSTFITDPEGSKIEIKTTEDGTKIVFSKDEEGKTLAIEERANGTRLYHISSDSTGLPSTHEIRSDQTEIVYFYNSTGCLEHLVELKPNGDRISTIIGSNKAIYSIEQRQIGGTLFTGWLHIGSETKRGIVWLHPDGEVSTRGDETVIADLLKKFSRFLDGVSV
ncbi:MAG: hypothetical protein HYY52_03475 [Candidatus Melainabacteria bacterium]|nr:hypothetical protein [Candidatus Melainabacteria bacterium]